MAILGGFAAAAFFATATLCSSRSSRMVPPSSVLAWVMITGLVVLLPVLAVSPPPDLGLSGTGWLLVSGGGNVGGLLLAYSALRIGKVGVVAPIVSTEGAIAAVLSVLAGEALSTAAAMLLPVIALGVMMAATGSPAEVDPSAPTVVGGHRPLVLAGAAAVCFGASLFATAHASSDLPVAWVLLPARLIGLVVLAVPLLARRRLRLTRRAAPLVLVAGLCEVLGFAAFAIGSRDGLAVAAVLASQFAAIAAVAAFVLFRERLTPLQISGVSLVAVGVAALTAVRA